MGFWGCVYGAATAFVVVASLWSQPTTRAALILAGSWAVCNALVISIPEPWCRAPFPLIDLICGYAFLRLWREYRAWWMFAIVALLLTECLMHISFWSDRRHLFGYALAVNLCYVVQLLLVLSPGGIRVVSWFLDWMLPRAGGRRPIRDA